MLQWNGDLLNKKLGGGTKVAGKMKSHIKMQKKEMEEIRCLQETIVNGK